jgi:hypothetical protein
LKQKKPTREPLADVAEFIRFIHSRLNLGGQAQDAGLWLSRHDEGSLFLDPEETRAYAGLVTALMAKHVPREDLSRRSVESLLQEALFASLDIDNRSSSSFEDRTRVALNRLLALLQAPSEVFRCWVPIEGLELDTRSARFGGISFVKFGRNQLGSLKLRSVKPRNRQALQWSLKRIRESNTWGSLCAAVDISARDSASAERLALRRTRQILDVLNLFSDLVPYNSGWIYLRGETAPAIQVLPIQKRGSNFLTVSFGRLKPLAPMSWKSLRATKHIALPLRSLDRIARARNIDKTCAALLLTGAQWAGRATIDRRREQGFLLYAIALETVMLPTKETQGLGHRLRLRVAHLLGETVAARERLAKQMTDLYDVRSKIVHAGSYEVTDVDLGRLRSLVKGTLFRLLATQKIHSMNPKQLSEWLDRKLLR